ncbi:unnamed protein product, partial [Brassica rapa subsp. trilocularis]
SSSLSGKKHHQVLILIVRLSLQQTHYQMDSQSVRVLAELEEQLDMDREENEAELQGAHSETQVTQPTKTVFQSNKHLKADVWKEYIPVGVGIDGKNR